MTVPKDLLDILRARRGAMPSQDETHAQMARVREIMRSYHLQGWEAAHRVANAMGEYDAADRLRQMDADAVSIWLGIYQGWTIGEDYDDGHDCGGHPTRSYWWEAHHPDGRELHAPTVERLKALIDALPHVSIP